MTARVRVCLATFALLGLLALMAGCAASTSNGLSSLSREVKAVPLRGQSPEQIRQDDAECVTWTRATKGKDEPMPSAELRYAVCAVARGYQADVIAQGGGAFGGTTGGTPYHVSSTVTRTLETVLADWRACRMGKTALNPWTAAPYSDAARGRNALACLAGRGYAVTPNPDADPLVPRGGR
jgi:hypothetical protein